MAANEPLIGSLIAERYRVVRRLGAGGMGTVYVALQEPLDREVALKVVRRDLAGDEVALERFRREAMSLAQVQHPHIVTLLDFGDLPGGALYFAMELVPGQTLRQRLKMRGAMAPQKTYDLIKQTCAALSCAHGLGIIHRDLKPENILLMEAAGTPDFVKVVDFGVAKVLRGDDVGASQEQQLTDRDSLVGTPGYIAPEVSLHGVTTDPRSDLYSLGVIWFECLAGGPPFRAPTPTALVMAHALQPPPPLPPSVPLPVAGLVSRLLAKDPKDRPSSAEELRKLVDQLPTTAAPAWVPPAPLADPTSPTASSTPMPTDLVSARGVAAASIPTSTPSMPAAPFVAGAAVLAAVAGLALWALSSSGGTDPSHGPDAGSASVLPVIADAGIADAGALAPANDAGLVEDAGSVSAPLDAGTAGKPARKPKTPQKPKTPDGVTPDIY